MVTREKISYIVVGLIGTIGTYALYLLLLDCLGYMFSYSLVYTIGVIYSYICNSKLVFRVELTFYKAILYPVVYVVQYLTSITFIQFFILTLGIPESVAPIFVTISVLPLTYVMTKYILSKT